jgi:hypothetical protein
MDIQVDDFIECLKSVKVRRGNEGDYFETYVQGALDWRATIYTIDQISDTAPMPTKAVFRFKRGYWHLIQFG